MRRTIVASSFALLVIVIGCSSSETTGVALPATPEPAVSLYSPIDRDALALGLPDLVQGRRLTPSSLNTIVVEERDFVYDLAVRRILVEHALGPSTVTIEHKSDDHVELPNVAVSAVQIRGISSDVLTAFDPSFYLLLTSVTQEQWDWPGDKPGPKPAVIEGREVTLTEWTESGFQVAWYAYGDVLYIVMARNEQLLTDALRRLPGPRNAV